jgi:hypothetical protein
MRQKSQPTRGPSPIRAKTYGSVLGAMLTPHLPVFLGSWWLGSLEKSPQAVALVGGVYSDGARTSDLQRRFRMVNVS